MQSSVLNIERSLSLCQEELLPASDQSASASIISLSQLDPGKITTPNFISGLDFND